MAMAVHQSKETIVSILKEENAQLLMENNILRADIGYWKIRHQQAVEREEAFKKELQDKQARIKYLTRQLYEKKTEQSKKRAESEKEGLGAKKRKRGQQPDRPIPKRRDQGHLPEKVEIYDLSESEKYCHTLRVAVQRDVRHRRFFSVGDPGSPWVPENDTAEKVFGTMQVSRDPHRQA